MEKNIISLTLTERVINQLADTIVKRTNMDNISLLKFKLGLSTIVTNVSKMIVLYSLAKIWEIFIGVVIFHCGFMMIRRYSYGAHSQSSLNCTILSSVVFLGATKICLNYSFSGYVILFIGLYANVLLWKYSPGVTVKNKIRSVERISFLRKKSLMSIGCILIFSLLLRHTYLGSLLITGALVASLLTTPLLYKLLGDERLC